MPFHELIRVCCDECTEPLIVPQTSAPNGTLFHSHAEAIRSAEKRDWYVDAKTVRCPEHWPEGPAVEVTISPIRRAPTTTCRYCHLDAVPGLTTCMAHSRS